MFCMKCGAQLPDSAKFCVKCGAKTAVAEAPQTEIPGAAGTTPQANAGTNVGSASSGSAKPPKKKKGGIIAASVAGVAVAAAGVTAALNWNALQNTVASTFSSPEEYYQQVESSSIKTLSNSIAESYGSIIKSSEQKIEIDGISGSLTLQIDSKEILSMLEEDADMDMSWLKKLTLSGGIYAKDSVLNGGAGIGLNGTDILSADITYDADNAALYLAIPELSDKYISMDVSDYSDYFGYYDMPDNIAAEELKEVMQAVFELLPDESQVESLTAKYMGLVLKCLDNVEKEKNVTLKVGSVKQECTQLTVTVDAKTFKKIVKSVTKELADDKTIKKIFTDLCDGLSDNTVIRDFCQSETAEMIEDLLDIDLSTLPYLLNMLDADEIYDLFRSACLELNEEVDDLVDSDSSDKIEITVYVDKKGGIRGRVIDVNDGEFMLELANPSNGNDVGYKAALTVDGEELFVFSGTGKESGGKFNGEFTLASEPLANMYIYNYRLFGDEFGSDLLTIDAKNFDINGFKQGWLNGSFTITSSLLNYQLNRDMGWLYPSGPTKDLAITLDSAMSDTEVEMTFGLKDGKTSIGSIGYALKLESNSKVSVPSKNSVLPLDDLDDLEAYWKSINWDKFTKTLEKAGLPSQITKEINLLKSMSLEDLLYYMF